MPKRKPGGWKTRCGIKFPNRRICNAHCKNCMACQAMSFTTGKWEARCGRYFKTKILVKKHQPSCQECRNLAWKMDGHQIVVQHKARCGVILNVYRLLIEHQR